ncbi:MAG: radical SAM protein [Pirellula sp.]
MNKIGREEIESLRGTRVQVNGQVPLAVISEREPASKSSVVDVLTVFLVGAECSFRCSMCDLWKYTLEQATAPGDLVQQLRLALSSRKNHQWIKLYNASNFFDPRSVPFSDLPELAALCEGFGRVIVENHPKIRNRWIERFAEAIDGTLEIAMGLETIHPESMRLLNKEFSLLDFEDANRQLCDLGIDRRVFVLLQPPGTPSEESIDWVTKTLQYAEVLGVRHGSIIPTRGGNGMMERFEREGLFRRPGLWQLEQSLEQAFRQCLSMVVTADLWNIDELSGSCKVCFEGRLQRLEAMNHSQQPIERTTHQCDCVMSGILNP